MPVARIIRSRAVRRKIGGRDGDLASHMTLNRWLKAGKIPPPLPRQHEKEPMRWYESDIDRALGLDLDDETRDLRQ